MSTITTAQTPHDLRHAGATAFHDAAGDVRQTQEFLGHSSVRTTQIYTHVLGIGANAVRSPLDE